MANSDIISEKWLEKQVTKHIESIGGVSVKLFPHLLNGIPDRMGLLPNAKVVFIEVKTTKKKPTPLQCWWGEKLKGLGFKHYIVDSLESLNTFTHETT